LNNCAVNNQNEKGQSGRICKYPLMPAHRLFENQAEKFPDCIAAYYENEKISYSELNSKSNQVARYLQKLGVSYEVPVGILMERSIDVIIAILGVLKAGGAYIPLEPAYPKERLNYMINDSKMPVLITKSSFLDIVPDSNVTVVNMDLDWERISKESKENPDCNINYDNLVYIIYTSGSTGTPKGVEISHGALVNLIHSMLKEPGMTCEDRLLSVSALSFDMSVFDIFVPLSAGASIIMVGDCIAKNGTKLIQALEENSITVMQATPSTWRMLLESGWKGNKQLKILCGGEALPRELVNQLNEKGAVVWNMYGLTELTVYSVISKVTSGDGPVPIGYPIDNTQAYILDEDLKPVPFGEVGELYIGGDGVGRGYFGKPELTSEKYIQNPFSDNQSDRICKTGDLARFLPDGSIEYLGRADFQIKLRGFRIELGEIESAIEKHPWVQQAVVVKDNGEGDQHIVAYFRTKSEQVPSSEDMRSFLKNTLPDYMIPSFFVQIDEFPLTPNGKVDRKSLQNFDYKLDVQRDGYVAPSTSLEKEVAKIWSDLLKIDDIGIYDNFMELGGHSLLANRLTLRINDTFGIKLSLMEVLTSGLTVADMVKLIENKFLEETDNKDLEAILEEVERTVG